jgi:hypothetical protein
VINLGPFGSSHPASTIFDLWTACYLAIAALIATVGFERRDL